MEIQTKENQYINKDTGELVEAVQFTRPNIAEIILFTDGAATGFRCASRMPYHKFHCNFSGMSIPEDFWFIKTRDGEITVMSNENFIKSYANSNSTS